jgi:hypothetical protein
MNQRVSRELFFMELSQNELRFCTFVYHPGVIEFQALMELHLNDIFSQMKFFRVRFTLQIPYLLFLYSHSYSYHVLPLCDHVIHLRRVCLSNSLFVYCSHKCERHKREAKVSAK